MGLPALQTEAAAEIPQLAIPQLVWPTNDMFIAEVKRRMGLEHGINTAPVSWTVEDLKKKPEDRVPLRPQLIAVAKEFYKSSIVDFVKDCVWVYEPRNAGIGMPVKLPVCPFPRQEDFLNWLVERSRTRTSAPVEKSRDSGATWMASAFAVWMYLYTDGSSVGFGSRVIDLIDLKGNPSTIFEKIRSIIRNLPWYLKPAGLNEKVHFNFCRILNPETGSSIVGEGGDNIGRGGRTSVYFIDEAAHLAHAAAVEAALTATTDCRIDISSPLVGTIFNQWCQVEPKKFIFDIDDAPWHTAEWKEMKKDELTSKGLGHLYAQEYLRDATAGIEGQLIKGEWVEAIVGAADKLFALHGIVNTGARIASCDPGDGGKDPSAMALMYGFEVMDVRTNPGIQSDDAGDWVYGEGKLFGAKTLRYESVGVGAGTRTALKNKPPGIGPKPEGWNPSGEVVKPDEIYYPAGVKPAPDPLTGKATTGDNPIKNKDMFKNAKAQAWWYLRDRIYATYRVIMGLNKRGFDIDLMISLSREIKELAQLKSELCQIVFKHDTSGKILIDKQPDGFMSPNRADAVMIANAPSQINKMIFIPSRR